MARRKPHDPAEAARKAAEKAEREAEIARMKRQGATVTLDRAGKIVGAYRSNVANLLLRRGAITQSHHDAFHRLAVSWAKWKGLDGGPEMSGGRVDGGSGCREIVTDRMISGGREVTVALEAMQPRDALIMTAFMVSTVEEDRPMHWRGILQRLGIKGKEEQAAKAVCAFESLRAFYEEPRRAAA